MTFPVPFLQKHQKNPFFSFFAIFRIFEKETFCLIFANLLIINKRFFTFFDNTI